MPESGTDSATRSGLSARDSGRLKDAAQRSEPSADAVSPSGLVAPPISADLLERLDREKAWEGTQLGLQVVRNEVKRLDDDAKRSRSDTEALQAFQADCVRTLDRLALQLAALEKALGSLQGARSVGGKGGDLS
jgi:hypothetical protein